jgi:hypothetical protein
VAIVPVFKKGNSASFSNYRHYYFVCLCCICNWPFGCWYSTLK